MPVQGWPGTETCLESWMHGAHYCEGLGARLNEVALWSKAGPWYQTVDWWGMGAFVFAVLAGVALVVLAAAVATGKVR